MEKQLTLTLLPEIKKKVALGTFTKNSNEKTWQLKKAFR